MQIKLTKEFEKNFESIYKYIANDKLSASKKFKNELLKQIKNISKFPYKHRKSIYFDNNDIRDMIFKGYTIVYKIEIENNIIVIVDIFNQNKR